MSGRISIGLWNSSLCFMFDTPIMSKQSCSWSFTFCLTAPVHITTFHSLHSKGKENFLRNVVKAGFLQHTRLGSFSPHNFKNRRPSSQFGSNALRTGNEVVEPAAQKHKEYSWRFPKKEAQENVLFVHQHYFCILWRVQSCLLFLVWPTYHQFLTGHTSESSSTPVFWQAISGQVMGAPPPSVMARRTYCCKHWRGRNNTDIEQQCCNASQRSCPWKMQSACNNI